MTVSDRSAALDSNLLLLYLVSRDNHLLHLIGTWKRLNTFERQDAVRLVRLTSTFRSLLTTPHVLTETSNFIGQLAESAKSVLLANFKSYIDQTEEYSTPARVVSDHPAFSRLRLTDCALLELPIACTILTVDFHLAAQRRSSGGLVMNFNHTAFFQ